MSKFADELFTDLMREHGPTLEQHIRLGPDETAGRPVHVDPARLGDSRRPHRQRPWLAPAAAASGVLLAVGLAAALGEGVQAGRPARHTGPAGNGRAETAYVFDGDKGTVTPISPATGKLGKPVTVGPGTRWITLGKHRSRQPSIFQDFILPGGTINYALYSAGPKGLGTAVLRTSLVTGSAGRPVQLGQSAGNVVITPNGRQAYVTYYSWAPNGRQITGSAVRPVWLDTGVIGRPLLRGPGARTLAMLPDGRTLYVTNLATGTVTPVSTATNRPGRPMRIPNATAVQFTPGGRTGFVIAHQAGTGLTVTSFVTATGTPGRTVAIQRFDSLFFAPDGSTVYAENSGTSITPVSLRTGKPGKAIPLNGAGNMVITPNDKTGYIVNVIDSRITPLAIATNSLGKPLKATAWPLYIVVTPDGRHVYGYSNNSFQPQVVTPVSTATNTAGAPIRVWTKDLRVLVPGGQARPGGGS